MEKVVKCTIATSTAMLCEMAKLKSQQKYLEATQSTVLLPTSLDDKENALLTETQALQEDLSESFKHFKLLHKQDYNDLADATKTFRNTMITSNGIDQFDTKDYRDQVVYIDRRFRDYLKRNSLELKYLKETHCGHMNEINSMAISLNKFDKINPTIRSFVMMKQAARQPLSTCDNQDIQNFTNFLQEHSNGHCGSWLNEEHCIFIKFKNKYKHNLDACFGAIQAQLTGNSNIIITIIMLFILLVVLIKLRLYVTKSIDSYFIS